mmetsp:Transcript_27296/g.30664  ORF Transcript_27296/g.30664 Transcript_27296/m.30664 type:complete len:671 (-) Transcript_27296:95-2107(-)
MATMSAAQPAIAIAEKKTEEKGSAPEDDPYSMKVKPKYILSARAESLGPIKVEHIQEDPRPGDDRDSNNAGRGGKKRKKRRGQNKKRPRDVRQDDSEKVCMAIMRDDPCPYGDSCRFSHDLEGYMKTRPTDIVELKDALGGNCPNYENIGYCMYGAMCRVGSSHVTKTGQNLRNEEATATKKDTSCSEEKDASSLLNGNTALGNSPPVSNYNTGNILPRDVQSQLRKNKYPFQCKRHFEVREKKEKEARSDVKDDCCEEKKVEISSKEVTTNSTVISNGIDSSEIKNVTSPTISSFTPIDELKTKKIVDFSNKVYVAPLTTVGNLPFRRIMKQFGADITCGEMALSTNLLSGQASEWALLKRHPSEDIFGVQLAAAHADQYTRVSELVEKYADVDFVDLNLGCPLDLLCDKGAGAALMMRERKLKGSLEGMSNNLSCSITVKMRTGWNMHKPFAHELVPKIQSWNIDGLAAIMIHGRSRLQRYKLDANWDYISQVANESKNIPKIPIIGNGDIFSYSEYKEKVLAHDNLSTTAMLGRGALIKPWLPTEIKEKRDWDISATERLEILKNFVRHGLEHWGSDQQGINNTRRFLLEWLSFLHRYVPVGLLEVLPQKINQRPPLYMQGRNDLETLFLSPHAPDWIKITELLLGPVTDGFAFRPKHKSTSYETNG